MRSMSSWPRTRPAYDLFVTARDLPEELHPWERHWLAGRLERLKAMTNTALGTYAESLVALSLPGCKMANDGWAAVDMVWENRTIEVKSSSGRQSWHREGDQPSRASWRVAPVHQWFPAPDGQPARQGRWSKRAERWSEVWILARCEGQDHLTGWHFYVVPRWWLDQLGQKSISEATLKNSPWRPAEVDQLADQIRSLDGTGPTQRKFDFPPSHALRPPEALTASQARRLFD